MSHNILTPLSCDDTKPPLLLDNGESIDDDLFISARQETNHNCNDEDYTASDTTPVMKNIPLDDSSNVDLIVDVPTQPNIEPNLASSATMSPDEQLSTNDQFLHIIVTEPQKIGDGMGAYVAYHVTSKTNMTIFRKQEFSVLRRFSDFLGLHDKLTEKYLKLGRIIPPAPEKSVIGTTKIKISGTPNIEANGSSPNGTEFIEKRRASLERYLRRTSQHPVLLVDPDFREFLEADMDLPKATNTSALSGAGVMRLFNKVGETVNKITYRMDETDPWFEDKLVHIETLEVQLRKLLYNAEILVNYRKELSHLTNEVSRSAALLSACEDYSSLSKALSQLADTEEKVESLHLEQANTDFFILCELLKDYLGLLGAVRDAFHERTKLFQHWQHSQQMLAKKREAKTKFELTNRTDRLDQASTEVVEWEAKVERGQESFDKISRMIKSEMERFEKHRISDFKTLFIRYLENHLNHQTKVVKYWEEFLPDAKAIG